MSEQIDITKYLKPWSPTITEASPAPIATPGDVITLTGSGQGSPPPSVEVEAPAITTDVVNGLLCQVARLRNRVASCKNSKKAMLATIENTDEYRSNEIALSDALAELEDAIFSAKVKAMEFYQVAKLSKKHAGWSVVTKRKQYVHYDVEQVRTWALKNVPTLVVLDVGRFEEYAIAMSNLVPVPDVVVGEELQDVVQLDSDLSIFIPKGGV